RAIRRTLKAPVPDLDDSARLAIREQVKAIELDAERRLIGALEALAPPPGATGVQPVADALVAAARAWTRVVPRADLVSLAARVSPCPIFLYTISSFARESPRGLEARLLA